MTDNACKFDGEEDVYGTGLHQYKPCLQLFKDSLLFQFRINVEQQNLLQGGEEGTTSMILAEDDTTG
jgi:hypothetical protein